jgi:hypothetical protein
MGKSWEKHGNIIGKSLKNIGESWDKIMFISLGKSLNHMSSTSE